MKLEKAVNKSRSYLKDKNGWVTFGNGKKKVKLRKLIADYSQTIASWSQMNYVESRDFLISYYELDGIKGLNRAYQLVRLEKILELEKQQSDVRNKTIQEMDKVQNFISDIN